MKAAAVDIGTNSTRLLIVQSSDDGFQEAVRQAVVTRLGQGVDATGELDPEAMARTLGVLAEFGRELSREEVQVVRAVATSASRDATNRDEFFDAVDEVLGVAPELISGEEEARLAFAGATRLTDAKPSLVIDVGGGSTEFVLGNDSPMYMKSIDVGSVRLTERIIPERPASPEQVAKARAHTEKLLAEIVLPETPTAAIGVAGTFTSLSAINLDLDTYERAAVHRSRMTYSDLLSLVDFLAALTVEETEAIPSLDPARAPVILGGAVVAVSSLLALDLDEIQISEQDLLHGIVGELLAV